MAQEDKTIMSSRKDDEVIRLELLTNVCRMMVMRSHMDISKYAKDLFKNLDNDMDFNDIEHHWSSMIDNSKFLKFFKTRSEKDTYIIDMDSPFSSTKERFDGSKLIVSIIPHKVTDVKHSDIIGTILSTYPNNHKLFIVDSIIDRAQTALYKTKNIEVFTKDNLMIDLMSHFEAPHRCKVLYDSKSNIPKILENDPLARYYNAKSGSILKIVGNTVNNGFETRYRKVIDPKPVF